MTHPHVHVHQIVAGHEVFPVYCPVEHEGWSVSHTTQSLVFGSGIPRVHVPLSTVISWQLKLALHCPYDGKEDAPPEPRDTMEELEERYAAPAAPEVSRAADHDADVSEAERRAISKQARKMALEHRVAEMSAQYGVTVTYDHQMAEYQIKGPQGARFVRLWDVSTELVRATDPDGYVIELLAKAAEAVGVAD